MRTYEMAVRGAELPDGKRYSVLQPLPGEKLPAAAFAMGELRPDAARLHRGFAALLDDAALSVRLEALRAAGKLGDLETLGSIARALSDPRFARAAADAVATLPDAAVPALEDPLAVEAGDPPPAVLQRVAAALAAGEGPKGDARLERMLVHGDPQVRLRAARALAVD